MSASSGVAVVGCGYWGINLVRNLAELGALSLACDPSPSARDAARVYTPSSNVVADFQEVLDSGVGALAIATPAETHYALARRALEAGKDVFVEKPLALTAAEGADLARLAQTRGLILMVGHVLEYHPAILRLLDLVHGGDLGDLRYIYSNRVSLGRVRREENILWSFAPHDIAIILRLVEGVPLQVTAAGGGYLRPEIADVTVTSLLFDRGVRAHVFVSWLHPFKEQRLVVIGSRKMASFDDVAGKLVLYDQRVEIREGESVPIRGPGLEVGFAEDEPLRRECAAFLEAVDTRRPPLTDGWSGVRVLTVLEAAQRSLSGGGEPIAVAQETSRSVAGRPA